MIIDTVYEKAVAKLVEDGRIKDISNKLLEMPSIAEKILFVDKLLKELKLLPVELTKVTKTEAVSSHYRNLGNESFKLHNDYAAWQYYNLSLLHAPINTDYFSFAIANRSAVFHALKKHSASMVDVNVVLAIPNYPKQLTKKLIKRRELCKVALLAEDLPPYTKRRREIDSLIHLKLPKHLSYCCASSVLDVQYNETLGRHVVAREDISPGDVIVKENPYFILQPKSQILFSCSYCLGRSANLYPCDHCCFVFYCSDECDQNAWKEYHRIECPIIATLLNMQFTKLELLALRTVIKARSQYDSWESFYKMLEDTESRNNSLIYGHLRVDGHWVYDSKYYPSIHALATNLDKRSISDIFQRAVTAVVFLNLLTDHTDLFKYKDDKSIECVARLLLHHIMTSPTNMHNVSSNFEDEKGNYMSEVCVGSAPYAFLSLINHSCAPNVVRCNMLGSANTLLVALRPIKKGMQLFDNYGFHHALLDRSSRQKALRQQYKFDCNCEACLNDWPTYLSLKEAKNLPASIAKTKQKLLGTDNIDKLQKGDLDTAIKLYKPLCVLLKMLEHYAPCVELADCQESFKQCLSILVQMIPFGYNQPVDWSVKPSIENK